MNIITISSPNKAKTIKRKGTAKESMGYISGYLSDLNDRGIDVSKITIHHKYINNNNVNHDVILPGDIVPN